MSDVLSILSECNALLSGHFLLSSGKHSAQYFQCARLLQFPDQAALVIGQIAKTIRTELDSDHFKADLIVGPAMGGIIVAYELARQLSLPAVFTERNENGIMTLRRGFEVHQGERIIIAEDVVTTGKSTLETANQLIKQGVTVVAAICVVDRRPKDAPNPFPWPLFSAVRQPAELWDPKYCPLCINNKGPAIKPGSRKVT